MDDDVYAFKYERIIYEASGVDRAMVYGDDRNITEEVRRRVNVMWEANRLQLKCRGEFEVIDASLLKVAIKKGFRSFVSDATMTWKLDPKILNLVDCTDGRTVLDYVRDELSKDPSPGRRTDLEINYTNLRRAGAQYREELTVVRFNTEDGRCPHDPLRPR